MEFARLFPKASVRDAEALLRCASGLQRLNEIACQRNLTPHEIISRDDLLIKVGDISAALGAKMRYSNDPRGCPVVLTAPDGRSVAVPGRGLSAAALRRMER